MRVVAGMEAVTVAISATLAWASPSQAFPASAREMVTPVEVPGN
jgi:hypothetical protein